VPGREVRAAWWATPGTVSFPRCFRRRREKVPVCMSSAHKPQTPTECLVPCGGDHCDFCGTPPVFKLYGCLNFAPKGNPVFVSGVARWIMGHVPQMRRTRRCRQVERLDRPCGAEVPKEASGRASRGLCGQGSSSRRSADCLADTYCLDRSCRIGKCKNRFHPT
jgi:hypothetical protein